MFFFFFPDYKLCAHLPSVIAGASIAAALNGLEYAAIYKYDLFTKLHVITGAKSVSKSTNRIILTTILSS